MLLRHVLLLIVTVIGILTMLWLPAIPQDPIYHHFADQRSIFGINHFFNVISNLPFIAVGISGLVVFFKPERLVFVNPILPAYRLLFAGVAGVGIGSIYYHLAPSNETLIWDRLPMSLSFMALFTILLAEYISIRLAEALFYPLVLMGMFSVGYWYMTELQGHGDLRLYGLIQFLPVLLMPLILWSYPGRFTHGYYYWLLFGFYVSAKIFELYDAKVYEIFQGVSGHSLKHLLAAMGGAVFLVQLKIRHEK